MIFIIPILMLALSTFILIHFDRWDDEGWHIFGAFTLVVSAIVAITMVIGVVVNRMNTMSMHEQREAIQQSYDTARTHGELETATIAKDIAEFNKDLAEYKYWNKSIWFDVFYHDSIEDVEPVE